jgi:AhpD family alkylhydroperoxidase
MIADRHRSRRERHSSRSGLHRGRLRGTQLGAKSIATFSIKGVIMKPRIDFNKISPAALKAMMGLQAYVNGSGLEARLLELVKMRASQINGCAWCIDMHTKDARAAGETEQRLYLLDAWREAPMYSPRERVALEWTEAVTLVHETHVPDEVYRAAREHFTEEQLVSLTLAIVAINGWNRINVAFRNVPGSYRAGQRKDLLAD